MVPPFQSPDEFNHFYRAYQVSEGKVLPIKLSNRLGGYMPQSIDEFYSTFRFAHVTPDFRFKTYHLAETFDIKIQTHKTKFNDFANTSNYSPLSYLPQAFVISLLRFCQAPLGLIYYAGRLITFLVWLLIVFYCIKVIPVFKWLLAFLALLPTNIFIANSFSADNVTNILAFLWISQIFKLTFSDKNVSRKNLIALILLAILLPLAKLVYAGLIVLIFIIPRHKFANIKSQYFTFLLVIVPAGLISLLWVKLVSHNHIPFDAYHPSYRGAATLAPGSDFHKQLNVILADPLYFPGVVFNSIFNPNQLYLHTYIGAFGTHLYHHLPAWLSIISYAIILYVAVSSERTGVFNIRQRLILLTAFFVAFVFLLATIHLYWDPVGSGYVWLLQGRYLIPLFPLLFIVIGDVFTVSSTQSKWPLFATAILLNASSIHLLYKTYFSESCTIVTEAYSGLELSEAGYFNSSNARVKFSDHNNITTIEKRNGKSAAMLAPHARYGLDFKFSKIRENDIIEFEIWRKGKSGVAVLTSDDTNCKPFLNQITQYVYEDSKGWQKLTYWLQHTDTCCHSHASFYVYNLMSDTAYFDDIRVRHKRPILIPQD